jgi:DNA-binding SARP family transcriptional activator
MQLQLAAAPRFVGANGAAAALAARDAALLAWLALEGPTPRIRLAQLLWPDSDADAARNALRQRLFNLRKVLGFEIVVGTATLALGEGVTHDLEDADSVLGEAPPAASGEFAAWLAQQRQRRTSRTRDALVELAEMAERARDFADALNHAQELLALEPLSEAAHRRVMRLHYLSGDRAAALLAFDRCEQVLKDEIGAGPSDETLALLATLNAAKPASAALVSNTVPASVLLPPRMIGRGGELAQLQSGWRAAQVVALIGEAGLGKTRLLQAFTEPQSGVVRAAGRPGDAGVPFATLARLLRAVTARGTALSGPADQLPAGVHTEIARVLPELDGHAPRPTGEGQRLAMQRAVRALLASQAGLVGLLVDDLHFADEASLEMLRALIDADSDDEVDHRSVTAGEPSQAEARTLRWALAYRPAEAGSPVQALHDALVEQARLVPIALAPLGLAALAELVDSLGLPGVQGKALAPGLLRRTGGNPLFVLETLKLAWVERTLDRLADSAQLPRPLSVGRLIERRIAQLSPAALALARVASIAGPDFSIGMAEQVLQTSAMQFADGLNELEAAQVMRGNAFAHDLVYDAVHASVPATIAAHTHARVAAYLEPLAGEPARIAQHWIDAAQAQRALPWLDRAATAAGAAGRRKEQVVFLERKSEIEEAADERTAAFETLMQAAELQVTLDSEVGHGAQQCDRLARLAGDLPQRIRALLQRAHLDTMRGALGASEAAARQALREATRAAVPAALTVECRHRLATVLTQLDRSAEAIVHFEACLSWIDEHGSDAERCEFHGDLASARDSVGRVADALPHHELATHLAQQLGHHGNLVMSLANQAANRVVGGHLRDAQALLQRAALERSQVEDPSSLEGFAAITQAICDYQSGRYRQALRAINDSLVRLDEFAPGFRIPVLMHRCVCWAQLGQWARLHQELEAVGDGPELRRITRLRKLTLRYAMELAQGRRNVQLLEAALEFALEGELHDHRHAVLLELAMARAPDAGLRLLDEVGATAAELGHAGTVIAAQCRSARLAAVLGEHDLAGQQARAALAGAAHADLVHQYRAELWLHCGAALDAVGDHDQARKVLETGREWIEATAAEHVPVEFRDSFLQRNPVNRRLLELAGRLSGRTVPRTP